ncbi:porin family protein [Myroides odoratimimus]|uniref:porin family protein n=1 Tax=Myroides TaxID=76831 RepID=UPI0025749ED3|nr:MULTISPECIES: porin family protein [Myroides]MDM1398136.1 PorT family protein [Myroides odoratimimus]MDO5857842.1 porin family protein [Myroides odoratimimus]
MRKITLSLVAALAIGFSANAQTPDVKIGAKAGLNVSNLTNSDASSRTSFHVGAVAEIFINEKFSIQPEILYSEQGFKIKESDSFNGVQNKIDVTSQLSYINIPIMAKYYLVKGLNVQVGPQFGFNVKAKNKINDLIIAGQNVQGTGFDDIDKDFKDSVKSFDFGVNFGAGYELPMGVFFDARYNVGLSKVNKEGEASKNGVFQLSVGYKF